MRIINELIYPFSAENGKWHSTILSDEVTFWTRYPCRYSSCPLSISKNLKQNILTYRVFLTAGEIFLKICLKQKNNRVVKWSSSKVIDRGRDNYTEGEILKISWELRQAFRFYLPRKFKIHYFS